MSGVISPVTSIGLAATPDPADPSADDSADHAADRGAATAHGTDVDALFSAERRAARRRSLARIGFGLASAAVAVTVWEIVARILGDPALVPTVGATAAALATHLTKPYPTGSTPLLADIVISSARVLGGFAIGTAIGVAVGALMASSRTVRHLVDPLVEFFRPIPPLAFIPLVIVWLGIGEEPKLALIVLGVAPIIIVATVAALDRVPGELLQASRSLGASPLRTLLRVRIRAALPGIVTGMRIALSAAWATIIAAEMLGAQAGLGFKTQTAGVNLQLSIVFAGILLIATIGLLMDACLRGLLRLCDPSCR